MKVKELYYIEKAPDTTSGSGLYLVLENGKILRHQTTDVVMPFEEVSKLPEKTKLQFSVEERCKCKHSRGMHWNLAGQCLVEDCDGCKMFRRSKAKPDKYKGYA